MSDATGLERGYLRWLRWYPKSFRRQHESEMLAVLMANARVDQPRPQLMEALDLMRGALWMRVRPSMPRSDRSAFTTVKLLLLGAVVELATAVTLYTTVGSVSSSIGDTIPGLTVAQWQAVVAGQIEPTLIAACTAVGFWLWAAWAYGRGHRSVRIAFTIFLAINTFGLVHGLIQGSALYARADLTVALVLWSLECAVGARLLRGAVRIRPAQLRRHAEG